MDEKTAKLVVDPNVQAEVTVQELLRQLVAKVNELSGLLRSQQDLLRRRGMNLPTGSLDALRALQQRLEALNKSLLNSQIELRQLRELARTAALINSSQDTDEVLNQVMDTVVRLTGAERGYIMLRNKITDEMEFRVARGIDQEALGRQDFVVSRTIIASVIEQGVPVLTDNASQDSRYQGQQSIVGFALRSILCVPLKVRDDVIGVVYCDNRILAGLFKQHELDLLTAFANQAAIAIENARLFESARAQLAEATRFRDQMENIFASIVTGIIATDAEGRIGSCNLAAYNILNLAGQSVLGKPLGEVFPDLPEVYAAFKRVQETNVQESIEAHPEIDGLGRRFWNVIASPLRDENDVAFGIAIVVDDLTEIKRREEQERQIKAYLPAGQLDITMEQIASMEVEEREITAIFADVRGFTKFSENLDPQVLMEVINRYLDVASESIGLQGGMIDKYMGDAVTGLFNTQINQMPNHAERCVRAAMGIINDLLALHEELPESQHLFYGIGIHTGPAVLGNVGGQARQEFGAMGKATEICKVLQENAGKGEVIISRETYELIKDQFECEERVPEKTKGYDLPVCYRVLRRKRGARPVQVDPELADLLKD
jgi:adenylate cyclase